METESRIFSKEKARVLVIPTTKAGNTTLNVKIYTPNPKPQTPNPNTRKTAAPAVIRYLNEKSAFTLLEVLTVVVLIGILSALAYSSLIDVIFTSRAKEAAQTMRTFAERALMEGKRQNKDVEIKLEKNNITATLQDMPQMSAHLGGDFKEDGVNLPNTYCDKDIASPESFNGGATFEPQIGISGIALTGYFLACGGRGYCAAAVKVKTKNSFIACIKRGSSASWEAL